MGWLDITISSEQQAYLGAALGMAAGAALAAPTGGMSIGMGAAMGASIGGSIGTAKGQESAQRDDMRLAQKEAEKARVESATKQMGAKQQAESLALAGLTRTSKTGTSQQAPGFIGQNLPTSAGTF